MIRRRCVPVLMLLAAVAGVTALGGCGASPNYAGTYELDSEAFQAAIQAEIDATEDPTEQAGMQMMAGLLSSMSMTITLNEDGSASATSSMMGQTEQASGAWTYAGETITITMTGGGLPESMRGTVKGDTLELTSPQDQEMPFPFVFRKKVAE